MELVHSVWKLSVLPQQYFNKFKIKSLFKLFSDEKIKIIPNFFSETIPVRRSNTIFNILQEKLLT